MNNSAKTEKYLELRDKLIAERNHEGFWTGELSTSALSTAVAIVALKLANIDSDQQRVESGYDWLFDNINADGGYGDTTGSVSNVSTTLLCYAAVRYYQKDERGKLISKAIEKWLSGKGIDIDSDTITSSVLSFYGKDYTFSLPILSMLNLCGIIPNSSLNKLPVLPFELTLVPASFYRFINLRVVSYALPALIGVGIYLHKHRGKGILTSGIIRDRFIHPALRRLNRLVPESGGFLEAIPLTAFVSMCLIACDEANNETVKKGLGFLRNQQREDGGWPIDTDLSTWVTTLSVKALGDNISQVLDSAQKDLIRSHLMRHQFKEEHPFNGAKPGGWGWTSYSGSVPDADDTPGAILALLEIFKGSREEISAIENGCKWLIDLQNNDGGFPTFCKGWGRLPFDRSCADLTGHAFLALLKTADMLHNDIPGELIIKIDKTISRALDYLIKNQDESGSWVPLWFGNQLTDDRTNPVYGTAKICVYLGDCLRLKYPDPALMTLVSGMVFKAKSYLAAQQNIDGSWGGKKGITGTIEETSLAVGALADSNKRECLKGISWLANQENLAPAPIGLYFALLWYHEKMYPLIYYTEALRRFLEIDK
jgi:prenyltransferase beta subunit